MKIVLTQSIKAPKNKVYFIFTDFQNIPANLEHVHHIDFFEGKAQPIVGMRMKETRSKLGKTTTEVLHVSKVDAPRLLETCSYSRGVAYKKRYRFEERDGYTHVTLTLEAAAQSKQGRVVVLLRNSLFRRNLSKALNKDLLDFKKAAEKTRGK